MKKILILGAGFLQSFVIKRARELGYYVYAVDKNPDAVGYQYADEYAVIDITNEEACLQFAISNNIDGVLNTANDYGVLTSALISETMNLPGIQYEVAKIIKNKNLVRKQISENNIDNIKQHFEITSHTELNNIKNKIVYPVMVKPSDGSGSRGIKKVTEEKNLEKAFSDASEFSSFNSVIVEDYIEGKELGVEILVIKKKPYVLGILDKQMSEPPIYAELGHCIPSDKGTDKKIISVINKAIRALKIDSGAVNMDILIDRSDRISIIDIGVRMGGNLIGSHLIPGSTKYDYMGNLIRQAVDDEIEIPTNLAEEVVVTRLLDLEPGKIKELPNFSFLEQKYNVKIYFNKSAGDTINTYQNNLDSCGYIVYKNNNVSEAKKIVELVRKDINENISTT